MRQRAPLIIWLEAWDNFLEKIRTEYIERTLL